jgi:replicative DNA helicase
MTREPPRNFEAEQGLLGSILVNNAAYHRVSEFLRPEHFADPLHGKLFEVFAKLLERGQVVSPVAIKAYVEGDEDLKAVGGMRYITVLAAASVHAIDAAEYARLVADAAARRRLIALASDALTAAYSPDAGDTAAEQVERLERGLYEVASHATEGGFQTFDRGLTRTIVAAEAAHKRRGQLTGVSTGLRTLDELLGGLHRSDLIILAGRPGMGKTALATNIAFAAARAHRAEEGADGKPVTVDGARVGFFSLEMSFEQLTTRIVAEQAGIPSERIRRGKLSSVEFDRIMSVAQELQGLPLYVDETPSLTIGALRTRARRQKRQHGLDLIVVDYLQMLSGSNAKDGRVQEVSEISRGLKVLAKELDVPVLALSQLSRAVESRTDKRPQLADLRDSGTIEQDADVVMFVYREEVYLRREGHVGAKSGVAEVLIEKQRHGPCGSVELRFDGATTKFSDSDPSELQAAA